MAHTKECNEHIPFYTPEEVFEVGTRLDTLPTDQGFSITSDSERFAQGVVVQVGISLLGRSQTIHAQVKEFEPARAVLIHGRSGLGKADIWLNLAPCEDEGGTIINYGVRIEHNRLLRGLESVAGAHLDTKLPGFAEQYRQNVVAILHANHRATWAA